MIETGACHDIILSDYLALSLAIPPLVKRPVASLPKICDEQEQAGNKYDNDVVVESMWSRKLIEFM